MPGGINSPCPLILEGERMCGLRPRLLGAAAPNSANERFLIV